MQERSKGSDPLTGCRDLVLEKPTRGENPRDSPPHGQPVRREKKREGGKSFPELRTSLDEALQHFTLHTAKCREQKQTFKPVRMHSQAFTP